MKVQKENALHMTISTGLMTMETESMPCWKFIETSIAVIAIL